MRKYLFFLFGLLVMFTPLESHAQSYELGLHVFMMDIGGAGIILVIIISGVTMAVLSCMIVMNILQITDLSFK